MTTIQKTGIFDKDCKQRAKRAVHLRVDSIILRVSETERTETGKRDRDGKLFSSERRDKKKKKIPKLSWSDQAAVFELQQSTIKAFNQIIRHKNIKKTSHAAQHPGTLTNTSVKTKNNPHRFHLGGTRGTSFEK